MKASKFYEELSKGTTSKGRRTLEDVKMVCDYLESEGIRISVSLIGREFVRQGIKIVEQSLRNNKKVMEYVGLRIKEQKVEAKEFNGETGLEEQIRALQHENMVLRGLIKNMKLVATQK